MGRRSICRKSSPSFAAEWYKHGCSSKGSNAQKNPRSRRGSNLEIGFERRGLMLRRYCIRAVQQRLLGVCPCSVTACYELRSPLPAWVSGVAESVLCGAGAAIGLKLDLCRRDGGRMVVSAFGRDKKWRGAPGAVSGTPRVRFKTITPKTIKENSVARIAFDAYRRLTYARTC